MEEQEQRAMTLFEAEGHSFVLRVWRVNRDDPSSDAEWRGWIEDVQTGQRAYFQQLQEIEQILNLALIRPFIDIRLYPDNIAG